MSSTEGRSSSSNGQYRRFFSGRLRRASFISPLTGERVRRNFSLRDASNHQYGRSDRSRLNEDNVPLLEDDELDDEVNHHPVRASEIVFIIQDWFHRLVDQSRAFATSTTGIGILKCSLAYFLGSLVTFVPALHQLIGHKQDSKHMVATVTVWFHPARSIGSMYEGIMLAIVALFFSGAVSFTSMGISKAFAENGLLAVGHVIVLVFFLGGGLGFIAWVKQRLNHPLVNVACSLASLGCITVLIKEGAVQAGQFSEERVLQVLLMVLMGIVATCLVNMIVLPISARRLLVDDLEKNTDFLGEILISITRAFLSGSERDLEDEGYTKLVEGHNASLKSMHKNLGEAKREYYLLGREKIWDVESRLVECLVGLAQDLGGLRSAVFAQFSIIKEVGLDVINTSTSSLRDSQILGPGKRSTPLNNIPEFPDDERDTANRSNVLPNEDLVLSPIAELDRESLGVSAAPVKNAEDMFRAFILQLGPPTKSLVYTLKQILDELPFKSRAKDKISYYGLFGLPSREVAVNENFHSSLKKAVDLYRRARKEALESLYASKGISAAMVVSESPSFAKTGSGNRSIKNVTPGAKLRADIEEVGACCGHFSFSILDFAEDILAYLALLDELKVQMEHPWLSWDWLRFWRMRDRSEERSSSHPNRARTFYEYTEENERAAAIPYAIQRADRFAESRTSRRDRPWTYHLYKVTSIFERDDVVFAAKVGIGAILYALPAFIPDSRPFFVRWRGEWGLVSYMAVCCMTVGASNTTGINRIIGTIIGAMVAIIAWVTSSHHGEANPFLLALWGWIVATICFYIILAQGNGPMGRFILLTYNLGALYSYSLSIRDDDNDDDEGGIDPAIWDIAMHRVVAVIVGCIWGIIVTRCVWPISARKKLKAGLSLLWLRMGLVWKRDPLALFLLGEPRSRYMDIREESSLHAFRSTLDGLRDAAASEFELRGPFPNQSMKRMLDQTGRMLDAFHAMNVVISKNLQYTPGEAAVLLHTRPERLELSTRISHLFSVLASSIKLEYPLNDALPSIEHTRDRLLARIADFRRSGEGKDLATEQDYELLYAYVLVTGQLSEDINGVFAELETVFGSLNEDNMKLH